LDVARARRPAMRRCASACAGQARPSGHGGSLQSSAMPRPA